MRSTNLHSAMKNKNDEFYTQMVDIEKELVLYPDAFKGKIVYCNCDNPYRSNFVKYFIKNFNVLGLKKLIATCVTGNDKPYKLIVNEVVGDGYDIDVLTKNSNNEITVLDGDGDFRSDECAELLRQADIVVTNPPFSLFREFFSMLMEYDKKFLIIGNHNSVTYKGVINHIIDEKLRIGYNVPTNFIQPEGNERKEVSVLTRWFTNLDMAKRNEPLLLTKKYNKEDYPEYDNYEGIDVSKMTDIPCDYYGVMGVPITFVEKWCPDQFEIIGITKPWFGTATKTYGADAVQVSVNGEEKHSSAINGGPLIEVHEVPQNMTYYKVGDRMFIQKYARIQIRRKTNSGD